MKRVFLFLFIFVYICSIPSYARKVIVSNDEDRFVKSRTMRTSSNVTIPDVPEVLLQQQNNPTRTQIEKNVKNGVYVIPGYQGEKYETYYKPMLEKDFRPELMGRTWDYPDYALIKERYEKAQTEQDTAIQEPKTVTKKSSREAADYSYKDTIKNPNGLIETGYDVKIKEF